MARRTTNTKAKATGGLWASAKEEAKKNNFDESVPLDPGVYNMQLVYANIDSFGDKRQLLTKWAVVGDDDNDGTICAYFEGVEDEERIVWLQRQMMALGMDIDAIDEDNLEDDVSDAYRDAIEEGLVARVKVIEKDGYVNMRVQKAVEWDEEDLHDVKKLLGGKDTKKAASKKGKAKEVEVIGDDLEECLEAMNKAELKQYIKDEKLDIKISRKMTEDDIIDAIFEAVEE